MRRFILIGRKARILAGVVVAVAAAAGIGQGAWAAACDAKTATSKISWSKQLEHTLEVCAECHEGDAPEKLVILPRTAYRFMVNIPANQTARVMMRIDPGNPENSYLVHKLRGDHMNVGGEGAQMPLGIDPFTPQQIQLLVDWINDCSPEN